MIRELPEQECYALLTSTTVGRIGFVLDERICIFPVNYAVSGRDLVVRTSSEGALSRLAEEGARVAFEVDHHDDLAGSGWSVLMDARLSGLGDGELSEAADRVSPWAGNERTTRLRLHIDSISGRRVRRDPR